MPPRGFDWLRASACAPDLRLFGFLTDLAVALAIGGRTMELSGLPAWAQSCHPETPAGPGAGQLLLAALRESDQSLLLAVRNVWRRHLLRQDPIAELFGRVFTRCDAPLAREAPPAPAR